MKLGAVTGLFKSESNEELILLDTTGQTVRIPKKDIRYRKNNPVSLMPEGLQAGLTPAQFLDLLAYLESLR